MIHKQLTLGTGVRFPSPPPLWGCTWISTDGTMVVGRLPVVVIAKNDNKSNWLYYKLRHGCLTQGSAGVQGYLSTETPTITPRSHNDPSGYRKVRHTTDGI